MWRCCRGGRIAWGGCTQAVSAAVFATCVCIDGYFSHFYQRVEPCRDLRADGDWHILAVVLGRNDQHGAWGNLCRLGLCGMAGGGCDQGAGAGGFWQGLADHKRDGGDYPDGGGGLWRAVWRGDLSAGLPADP